MSYTLSAMEPGWWKLKPPLRSVEARTPEAPSQASTGGFNSITSGDTRGWFEHCKYGLH